MTGAGRAAMADTFVISGTFAPSSSNPFAGPLNGGSFSRTCDFNAGKVGHVDVSLRGVIGAVLGIHERKRRGHCCVQLQLRRTLGLHRFAEQPALGPAAAVCRSPLNGVRSALANPIGGKACS